MSSDHITNELKIMKIASTFAFIIVLSLAFALESKGQKDRKKLVSPSLVGKTLTIEDDGEEIILIFKKNNEVFISGSEFNNGVEATYEQEDDEVILQIGDEEILLIYDGERLEFDEEEYYPEGYDISAVGIDAYEARVFISSQGDTIRYRLFIPNDYKEDGLYPLVLFHHGAGGVGNDNIRNLEGPAPREWAGPERQAENPCIIVVPQIPANGKRALSGRPRTDIMRVNIQIIHEILDALEEEYAIDKNREYVTGLSMGGECTWMSMIERPDRFAAAAPICGGDWIIGMSAEERGKKFAQLPIWIFHGEADDVVSVDVSREAVKALKSSGGNPRYTEYPGVGHDSWTRAYRETEFIDWLFAQSRQH